MRQGTPSQTPLPAAWHSLLPVCSVSLCAPAADAICGVLDKLLSILEQIEAPHVQCTG